MSGKGQVLYSPPTSQVYQWVTNPKERSWWNIGCPCKPTAQEDKERWPGPPPPHCLTRASGGRDVGQKGARQTEWGGPGRESGGQRSTPYFAPGCCQLWASPFLMLCPPPTQSEGLPSPDG